MKTVKIMLEVNVPFDNLIDEKTFQSEYQGDINKLIDHFFSIDEQAVLGEEKIVFVKAEIIERKS